MIIKSMSRKSASFSQLFDYIVRDNDNDTRYNFTHNCFGTAREDILHEFYSNADNIRTSQGSNFLYHEILSITRSKQLSEDQQKDLLRDITQQYINARAKDCLVFAGLHDEKDNQLHYHLIISANKVDERRRYYHSKQSFDDIKVNLEAYVLQRYPELEQAKLISKDKETKRRDRKQRASAQTHEGEYIRRTGKQSKKQKIAEQMQGIFRASSNLQDYMQRLRDANIESYIRGKGKSQTMGFVVDGRKHRIKTLGIAEEFDDMLMRFDANQQQYSHHNKQDYTQDTVTMPRTKKQEKHRDEAEQEKQTDRGIFERTGDVLKEWVAGDFSQREQQQKTERTERSQQSKETDQAKDMAQDDMVSRRIEQIRAMYAEKEQAKQQSKDKGRGKER